MNTQQPLENLEDKPPQKGKRLPVKGTALSEAVRAKRNATARAKYDSDPRYRADCLARGARWRRQLDRVSYNAAQRAKLSYAKRSAKNAKQRARYQTNSELRELKNARERERYARDIEVRRRVSLVSRTWQKANKHKTTVYKKNYEAKPSRKEQRNANVRQR